MDRLNMLVGETRARLLRLVRRGARSINELAEGLGITDNAVRTHVAALERDGMVEPAGTQRHTGGKPARVYQLTGEAEDLFPKAYVVAFTELLATLREEEGEGAVLELLRRVGRRLGRRAAVPKGSAVEERVAAAAALLGSIGGSIEVEEDEDGGWSIEAAGCPLSRVVAESPDMCVLAESLVREVTGWPVVERCQKGRRPQCSFRVLNATAARARKPRGQPRC